MKALRCVFGSHHLVKRYTSDADGQTHMHLEFTRCGKTIYTFNAQTGSMPWASG